MSLQTQEHYKPFVSVAGVPPEIVQIMVNYYETILRGYEDKIKVFDLSQGMSQKCTPKVYNFHDSTIPTTSEMSRETLTTVMKLVNVIQ